MDVGPGWAGGESLRWLPATRPTTLGERTHVHLPIPSDLSRRTFGFTAAGLLAAAAVPILRRGDGPEDREETTSTSRAALTADRPAKGATDGPPPPVPDVIARSTWDPEGACRIEPGPRTRPARIHVHHTFEPVVTTPEEVPEALRSICRSHTERHFGGIGYHYAIDPFGRAWQARGTLPPDLPERMRNGAHAQGFNNNSIGVVLIGDFEYTPPSPDAYLALEALVAYLAWRYDIDPQDTVAARSTGGSATRYADGERVELPTICAHRQTGAGTVCPGAQLDARLPRLRDGVVRRLELAAAT